MEQAAQSHDNSTDATVESACLPGFRQIGLVAISWVAVLKTIVQMHSVMHTGTYSCQG